MYWGGFGLSLSGPNGFPETDYTRTRSPPAWGGLGSAPVDSFRSTVSGALRFPAGDGGCHCVASQGLLVLRKRDHRTKVWVPKQHHPGPCITVKKKGASGFSSLVCAFFNLGFFPFSTCALLLSELPLSPFSIFLILPFHCYSLCLLLQATLTQWTSSETTNDRMQ